MFIGGFLLSKFRIVLRGLNINLSFVSVVLNLFDPLLDEGGEVGVDLAWKRFTLDPCTEVIRDKNKEKVLSLNRSLANHLIDEAYSTWVYLDLVSK